MKRLEDFTKLKKPWGFEGVERREVRLKELVEDVKSGFALSKQKRIKINKDIGIPQLRPYNIANWNKIDLSELTFIPKNMNGVEEYFIIKYGDVLFNNTNSIELVGRAAVFRNAGGSYTYSNHITRIRVKKQVITPNFLSWYLNFLWNKGFFYMKATKWIGQAGISNKKLLQIKIPLPFRNGKQDLEIQKKIVEYIGANFSRIDKILGKKKKELEKLDELWESVLEQAFKPKEGEEWREMRLREVTKDVKSGFALSKQKRRKINVNNGFPQLRPYNIANWNKINFDELTYIPKSMAGIEEYFIKNDDVLFNNTNSIELVGRAAVYRGLNRNYTYSNHITRIRVKKQIITSDFLSWYLNYLWNKGFFYLKATKWIGQAGISNKKFLSTKIPLPFRNSKPDIEKQKEIANYLDNIYEKIKTLKEKNQKQIAQLEKMKESILDEVFNHENK